MLYLQILFTLLCTWLTKLDLYSKTKYSREDFILASWFLTIFSPFFPNQNFYFFVKGSTVIFSMIFLLLNQKLFFRCYSNFKYLYFYAILCILSILWSSDARITFLTSIEYFMFIAFFITWSSKKDTSTLISFLSKIALIMVFGGFFSYIFQNYSAYTQFNYDNRGLTSVSSLSSVFPKVNPNSLSQAALFFLILLTLIPFRFKPVKLKYILMGITLFVLICSRSRTSLFYFMFFIFILNSSFKRVIFFLSFVALLIVQFWENLVTYVLRGQDFLFFSGFSGRLEIWKASWKVILDNIVIGNGYRTPIIGIDHLLDSGVSTYDNTFMDVFYYTGVIGLIFVLFFVINISKVINSGEKEYKSLLLWLYGVVIVRALTGPTFHVMHINTIFLIIILTLALRNRKILTK